MHSLKAVETGRRRFDIIAHRGASGYAPENTAIALDLAVEMDATAIEIDVQPTRDGYLIVWHDGIIARTARTTGPASITPVRELTLNELRACDVGSWFNDGHPLRAGHRYENLAPLTLDEVLISYGTRLPLLIEPKGIARSPNMIRDLARALCAEPSSHRHAVLAHDAGILEALLNECPDIAPVLLMDGRQFGDLGVAAAVRFGACVSPHKDLMDARLVASAHWNDVAVYPHTVNHPGELKRVVELGADGVITDLPDHALQAFQQGAGRNPDAARGTPA